MGVRIIARTVNKTQKPRFRFYFAEAASADPGCHLPPPKARKRKGGPFPPKNGIVPEILPKHPAPGMFWA